MSRFSNSRTALGLSLCAAGLVLGSLIYLPYVRLGSELAADAPHISGFELIDVDRPWFPNSDGNSLATLSYSGSADHPLSSDDPAEYFPWLRSLGFDTDRAREGARCILTERSDDYGATFYCASADNPGELIVEASVFDIDGLGFGPLAPLSLLGLGVAVLILGSARRTSEGDTKSESQPRRLVKT